MFNKVKSAFYNVVSGLDGPSVSASGDGPHLPTTNSSNTSTNSTKFAYTRPTFLSLSTDDEIQVSADHVIRPIIVPRDSNKLPWRTGYAETINAGKSTRNEDQASFHILPFYVAGKREESMTTTSLPLTALYFGLFDGHAGCGASVAAANTLHIIIQEKLSLVMENLLPDILPPSSSVNGEVKLSLTSMYSSEEVTADSLVIGALESAFWEMDQQIKHDRTLYRMSGGCTALVALFILGKLFLANAGDSRAVLVKNGRAKPLSADFTPETEKERVRNLAAHQPHLLGAHYTNKEFIRRPVQKDLHTRMLYRDAHMTGWSVKNIDMDDLKFPVVFGEGKRSRVLATIGVTRGFGDHDLKAQIGNLPIKPFLSSQPEVRIFDLSTNEVDDNDVLIMGTDGLWDITTNDKAAEILNKSLEHFPVEDEGRAGYRYTMAAQDLVMHSRGKYQDHSWRTTDNRSATIDDISVFVIPLRNYKEEFSAWRNRLEETTNMAHGGAKSLDPSDAVINDYDD